MPNVCVVVPCYNEERRLRAADFLAFLDAHPDASLCFIDDGSQDGTARVLQTLQHQRPQQIVVLPLTSNRGKAEAVRAGVLHAAASGVAPVIGYWDADLSTPLDEVDRLLSALREQPACAIALGSRVKRMGAHIERRLSRHLLGRVFATCASGLLGFPVYDSQCGAKLCRATAVPVLFRDPFLTRWLFDLEMLVRLRNHYGGMPEGLIVEVPLGRWEEVGGSKLKLRDMVQVPLELLKIRTHYNRKPIQPTRT